MPSVQAGDAASRGQKPPRDRLPGPQGRKLRSTKAAGSIFVFVLSIGNFITPDLLGGGRRVMVGNLIYKQFLAARDWPFGSALAFLLIAVMMLLLFAQALVVRKSGGERPA